MAKYCPIGVFDSGYGGLTVLKDIKTAMPEYDYLYLGDNARAPYGNRSYESVYEYTLQSIRWFFDKGCELVVLACNTASAKALRTIQQNDLPSIDPNKRVLGVIRPTTEIIGNLSENKKIGIIGTTGTIRSGSYLIEIDKFFPDVIVSQQDCPMWVPLIENNEFDNEAADYFIKKDIKKLLDQSPEIDTLLLACTHYPLLINKIHQFLPKGIKIISQGPIVANALKTYLDKHPELKLKISCQGNIDFYTTDSAEDFSKQAFKFFGTDVKAKHTDLSNI